MEDYDERCKKLKHDIQLLINNLPHDEEYLKRLKKFIEFKTLQIKKQYWILVLLYYFSILFRTSNSSSFILSNLSNIFIRVKLSVISILSIIVWNS